MKDWPSVKDLIRDLYIQQNKSMKDVQRILKEDRGFEASERSLKSYCKDWEYGKNKRAEARGAPKSSSAYAIHPLSSVHPCPIPYQCEPLGRGPFDLVLGTPQLERDIGPYMGHGALEFRTTQDGLQVVAVHIDFGDSSFIEKLRSTFRHITEKQLWSQLESANLTPSQNEIAAIAAVQHHAIRDLLKSTSRACVGMNGPVQFAPGWILAEFVKHLWEASNFLLSRTVSSAEDLCHGPVGKSVLDQREDAHNISQLKFEFEFFSNDAESHDFYTSSTVKEILELYLSQVAQVT